jgi:hypothetical protein
MGPWRLAVARATVTPEGAATTATGEPTTAGLAAMGAVAGAWLWRARERHPLFNLLMRCGS